MHDIFLNARVLNASDPVNDLNDDTHDGVSNENVMLEEQSELHSNGSDTVDTTLQVEDDDLGNLFDEVKTLLCPHKKEQRNCKF